MFSNDKTLQNVADAVSKIMNEKLHPNQQKLDVHEPEKDKLTAHDFKKLRAGKKAPEVKKEEVEQEEEKSMTFSEMLAAYKEHGLAVIAEEPTQDEYEKEIKKAQAKSEGKEKAEVAKAAVQAVKNEETHTKIQVIDMTDPNNIQKSEIDLEERTLTEPEAKKKEEIVKSMKKKMPGFKERYGERAKSVMYATATKLAKEETESPEGYQKRDGRLIPKIHSKMSAHDHGYDYTHQTIEDAKSKSHVNQQHKEILKDNPHPAGSKEHKDWAAGANKAKDKVLKDFK
jgi:hypothetical protein